MNKNIKITFSKLTGEELKVDLLCEGCSVVDVPEDAAIVSICFSPQSKQLCFECYITDDEKLSTESVMEVDETSFEVMDIDIDIVECDLPPLRTIPDYPEYVVERARLHTFDEWPSKMKQTPQQLSDAGFFYTQKDDRVICFCCGGGLRAWEEEDDPWEQHALYYGKCEYLQLIKGSEYVVSVKEKLKVAHDETDIPDLSKLFKEN